MKRVTSAFVAVGISLLGCSSGDSGGSTGSAEATPYVFEPKSTQGSVGVMIKPPGPGQPPALLLGGYFLDYRGVPGAIADGLSTTDAKAVNCTKREAGSCKLIECALTKDPSFKFANAKYPSAGTMTIKRSTGPELMVTPMPPGNDYITSTSGVAPGADGETVTISATGADVPAFSETLPLTPMIVLTSPTGKTATASGGSDFRLSWTGGKGDRVAVTGSSSTVDATNVVELSCSFDADSGTGVIPSTLLSKIKAGTSMYFSAKLEGKKVNVGPFEVTLLAEQSATHEVGGTFTLTVGPRGAC